MLSGYYMLYITMPHVSVEVLLPAVFFSVELCCASLAGLRS